MSRPSQASIQMYAGGDADSHLTSQYITSALCTSCNAFLARCLGTWKASTKSKHIVQSYTETQHSYPTSLSTLTRLVQFVLFSIQVGSLRSHCSQQQTVTATQLTFQESLRRMNGNVDSYKSHTNKQKRQSCHCALIIKHYAMKTYGGVDI
jgi:hypothetical protein